MVNDFRARPQSGVSKSGRIKSGREREVLKAVAEGMSVKEIATNFGLSTKTVDAHKFDLMRKLSIPQPGTVDPLRRFKKDHKAARNNLNLRMERAASPIVRM